MGSRFSPRTGSVRMTRGLLLVALVPMLIACPRGRRLTPATPADGPEMLGGAMGESADSIAARRVRAQRDSMDRALAAAEAAAENARRATESERIASERRAAERTASSVAATIAQRIYFDYNAAELSEQSRTTLAAKAQTLSAQRGIRIRISGHSDSRGSDEYNLALGLRRAAAAKRYLVQLGIADDRIEIVTYGEEQPTALGEDEAAWQQNRRAEFIIVGDGREGA